MSLDKAETRRRLEVEDSLLNSRTTIFLATNSLWFAAVGFGNYGSLHFGMAVIGVLVSGTWFICGRQSRNVIKALTIEYLHAFPDDPIEVIVRNALWKPGCRSPTDLLGWELPLLFIMAWAGLLGGLLVACGAGGDMNRCDAEAGSRPHGLSNMAMQTDGRFTAAADRQCVRSQQASRG